MTSRHAVRTTAVAALLAGGASCLELLPTKSCGDRRHQLDLVDPRTLNLWTGDSHQIWARVTRVAAYCDGEVIANTTIEPDRFSFSTDDSSVAIVAATGLIQGIAPGSARVTTTWGDKSAFQDVFVTPPVARIEIRTAPRDSAVLNDTVSVTVEALDADGNPIPAAPLAIDQLFVTGPSSRWIPWIVPADPRAFRFVATWRGVYTIRMRVTRTGRSSLLQAVFLRVP